MTWNFEKFKGDDNLYAFCPECGFHYVAGINDQIIRYYNYCPMCGKCLYEDQSYVVWEQRHCYDEDVLMELYGKD